jgi:hypothetical protein
VAIALKHRIMDFLVKIVWAALVGRSELYYGDLLQPPLM